MPLKPAAERELISSLLKQVSRSFFLTLRALPGSIRRQIGLAYLLARTTDTIADTEIVPVLQRLAALQRLRGRILGTDEDKLNFGSLARQQGLPAERVLLERVEESLELLASLDDEDCKLIREVLDTITTGQELDLRRFDGASEKNIIALQTEAELDDYTWRVAGCVGLFWTWMCVEHQFSSMEILSFDHLTSPYFEELAIRFGKGLQLVNILRDLPADLQKGRCYIPAEKLSVAGLSPADLLSPANEKKFRPLYDSYLDLAAAHLKAGWEYTTLIPVAQCRVRLACAWPVLIGLGTLKRLRSEPVLDPSHRVKVSKAEVRRIVFQTLLRYPYQPAWRRLGPAI